MRLTCNTIVSIKHDNDCTESTVIEVSARQRQFVFTRVFDSILDGESIAVESAEMMEELEKIYSALI